MTEEIWAPVPGYEDLYEVSDRGRVRGLDRLVERSDGRKIPHKGRVLKPAHRGRGYLHVVLCRDGVQLGKTVHSLVAGAFLGPRPDGFDILHLDGNMENNDLSNLRYGTRSDNLKNTYDYGGKIGHGKLSLADVDEIRERLSRGEAAASIAETFKVHKSTIEAVKYGYHFAWYKGGDNDATQ